MKLIYQKLFQPIVWHCRDCMQYLLLLHFTNSFPAKRRRYILCSLMANRNADRQRAEVQKIGSMARTRRQRQPKEYPEYVGHFLLEFLIKRQSHIIADLMARFHMSTAIIVSRNVTRGHFVHHQSLFYVCVFLTNVGKHKLQHFSS